MVKYRIREEQYDSGKSKFFAEGCFEGTWMNISMKALLFNGYGSDWCFTIDDAKKVINDFKKMSENRYDEIKKVIIHEIE